MKTIPFRKILCKLLILFFLPISTWSQTPTEEQILESIEKGVPWLASQQTTYGWWGTTEQIAYTGFALTKLCDYAVERGFSPFDEDYTYHLNVEKGFDYIFSKVVTYGSGRGLCATPTGLPNNYGHEVYNAAIALMALSVSQSPDRVIVSGNALVNGKTFKAVQDEMVTYFAWVQTLTNGGWGYRPNYATSDNSHTGYVTLALKYAEINGSVIPASLKTTLSGWIDYIQDDATGGSGYNIPTQWRNKLKTGNLLTEQAFVGYPLADPRVQAAVNFIETTWTKSDGGDYDYGIGDPQTMFCLMKGFESFGIDLVYPAGVETNWFDVFTAHLLATQQPAGNWGDDVGGWDNAFLNTCWALFVLEKIVPNAPPVAVCQNLELTADENCQATASAEDVNNGSSDPEGDEITLQLSPEGPFGLGETSVVLTVTDEDGATSSCMATITVVDKTPPVIIASNDPIELLPMKNHTYELFELDDFGISVSDNCSELGIDDVKISKVTSDEVEDAQGGGDGNTLNDMVISDGCQSVQLRWERAADLTGRVYTIHFTVVDESGNTATTSVKVLVPHDNSGKPVIDEGPVYVVTGDCNGVPEQNSGLKAARIIPVSPDGYELYNYPNPFNTSTTIHFALPFESDVSLKVYNSLGQELQTLVSRKYLPGSYSVVFSMPSDSPGLYFYTLTTPDFSLTRKMMSVK